jgi:hypothetical protein
MPETVIELDLSAPWEPPEPPAPRHRLRSVAVVAVLATALGMLVAAAAPSRAGLLYTIDQQILRAQTAGGRVFFARYQGTDPGPLVEAHTLADGRLLWQRTIDVRQQLLVAGPDVVLLMSEDQSGSGDSSALLALDAATGRDLWTHPRARYYGTAAGVVVVEDVQPHEPERVVDFGTYEPPGVNRAGGQPQRRFQGLSARTGAAQWQVTVPEGSLVEFGWTGGPRLGHFTAVSRTGVLTRWDARTGRVTATHQLAWSGTVAGFSADWLDGSDRPADRIVLYPDGLPGAQVYDVPTGRHLFNWPGEPGPGLYRCTPGLFCTGDLLGMDTYDSTTGEHRWHLDGYNWVVGMAGTRLLVGRHTEPGEPSEAAIVDGRTGAVVKPLPGWQLLTVGERPLLYRSVDKRAAVLGELDPATGLVTVFAHAEDWYGNLDCSVDGSTLVCVVVGGLSVWRLPNRH